MMLGRRRFGWLSSSIFFASLFTAGSCQERDYNGAESPGQEAVSSQTATTNASSGIRIRQLSLRQRQETLFHWTTHEEALTNPVAFVKSVLAGSDAEGGTPLAQAKKIDSLGILPFGQTAGPGIMAAGNAVATSAQGSILVSYRLNSDAKVPVLQGFDGDFSPPDGLAILHSDSPAIFHAWSGSASPAAMWTVNVRSAGVIDIASVAAVDCRQGLTLRELNPVAADLEGDYAAIVKKYIGWLPLIRALSWGQFRNDDESLSNAAILEAIVTEMESTPVQVRKGFLALKPQLKTIFEFADPDQEAVAAFAANLGKAVKYGYSSDFDGIVAAVKAFGYLDTDVDNVRSLQNKLISTWKSDTKRMANLAALEKLADQILLALEEPSIDHWEIEPIVFPWLKPGLNLVCIDSCEIRQTPDGASFGYAQYGSDLVAEGQGPTPSAWVQVRIPETSEAPPDVRGRVGWVRAQSVILGSIAVADDAEEKI